MLFLSISYSISADCPTLIDFARGLGMESVQPDIWSAIQNDCCDLSSPVRVTCSISPQYIIYINWAGLGLNGTINGTAIPQKLNILNLSDNKLNGTIPNSFPPELTHINLYRNKLTGSIPSQLPDGLVRFSVWDNLLSGRIPTTLPESLTYLDLSHNQISGGIPVNLPPGLTLLHLHNNQLTGELPDFPLSLRDVWLGYSGNYGNKFTGTLSLNFPTQIFINDNWITDVLIQNSSFIEFQRCDLSNNPLLGNANIIALSACIKNGLYPASSLPNTTITDDFQTEIPSKLKVFTLITTQNTKTIDSFLISGIATTSILKELNDSLTINHILPALTSTELMLLTANVSAVTQDNVVFNDPPVYPVLIYGLLGGFIGLCILVFAAKLLFKHPKMHSKFGRKNSFGTLNTVATGKTGKSV